jgi:hypothetical protein
LGLSTSAHSTVLITRPQPARSMCGSAALVAWKVACRHTSMMALYLDRHSKGSDGGKSATCDLLFTCKHVLLFQACQQTNSGQEPRATLPNHKAACGNTTITHFSSGYDSIGHTYWMPALLCKTSASQHIRTACRCQESAMHGRSRRLRCKHY